MSHGHPGSRYLEKRDCIEPFVNNHVAAAKHLLACPDSPFRPLEGYVFEDEWIGADENAIESGSLERSQSLTSGPVAGYPDAVRLCKRGRDVQSIGQTGQFKEQVKVEEGLPAGEVDAIVDADPAWIRLLAAHRLGQLR
jgi:hypothetical protein